jgi:hypothetical protein
LNLALSQAPSRLFITFKHSWAVDSCACSVLRAFLVEEQKIVKKVLKQAESDQRKADKAAKSKKSKGKTQAKGKDSKATGKK